VNRRGIVMEFHIVWRVVTLEFVCDSLNVTAEMQCTLRHLVTIDLAFDVHAVFVL